MLAIRNGRVLSDVGEAEPADVLIDGEEIVHVGQLGVVGGQWDREIDAVDCLVLPGLINAHTHARDNLLRGVLDNYTLEDLRGFSTAHVPDMVPDDLYVSAALGAIEMVRDRVHHRLRSVPRR